MTFPAGSSLLVRNSTVGRRTFKSGVSLYDATTLVDFGGGLGFNDAMLKRVLEHGNASDAARVWEMPPARIPLPAPQF